MTLVNPHIILLSLALLVLVCGVAVKLGVEAWRDVRHVRRGLRRMRRRLGAWR